MGVDGARPSQWREQSDFPPPPQDACSLTLIHPQTSWCGLGRRQGDPHLPEQDSRRIRRERTLKTLREDLGPGPLSWQR